MFESGGGLTNEPAKLRSGGKVDVFNDNDIMVVETMKAEGVVVMYRETNETNTITKGKKEDREYDRGKDQVYSERKFDDNLKAYNKDSVNDGQEHEGNDIHFERNEACPDINMYVTKDSTRKYKLNVSIASHINNDLIFLKTK